MQDYVDVTGHARIVEPLDEVTVFDMVTESVRSILIQNLEINKIVMHPAILYRLFLYIDRFSGQSIPNFTMYPRDGDEVLFMGVPVVVKRDCIINDRPGWAISTRIRGYNYEPYTMFTR